MPGLPKAVHIFKTTKRTNRVMYVSFSFDGVTADEIAAHRNAVRRRLSRQARQNCRFTITTRANRSDWFIAFEHSWPERDLDRDLKAIATEQGLVIFVEPGIPHSEMTADAASFRFTKRPGDQTN